MVLDTSALIAILLDEPEQPGFLAAIQADANRLLSAGSALECAIVVMRRAGAAEAARAAADLDALIDALGLEIEPVTAAQVALAADAYRRYGKGLHPAGLNYGDCFAYALARESGEKLLFKGGDFAQTDLAAVEVSF